MLGDFKRNLPLVSPSFARAARERIAESALTPQETKIFQLLGKNHAIAEIAGMISDPRRGHEGQTVKPQFVAAKIRYISEKLRLKPDPELSRKDQLKIFSQAASSTLITVSAEFAQAARARITESTLSPRESEVVQGLGDGLTLPEIAARLPNLRPGHQGEKVSAGTLSGLIPIICAKLKIQPDPEIPQITQIRILSQAARQAPMVEPQ